MLTEDNCPGLDGSAIDRVPDASGVEKAGKLVPVLGWIVSNALWSRRHRPTREMYLAQLESRPEVTLAAWGDDLERVDIAARVCQIAGRNIGWPMPKFVPWDPMRVVLWAFDDGLDDVQAILDIEDDFGIEISDEELTQTLGNSLGEFVDEIRKRASSKSSLDVAEN